MTLPTENERAPQARRFSPVLVLLLFPLLGLLAAVVMLSGGTPTRVEPPTPAAVTLPPAATQPRLTDRPAPDFTLRTLDQTTVSLSDYRGRVVFLNFWATWCEPCTRELPVFEAFSAVQGDDGAVVLAVNLGETYDQVNAYLGELGISGFPVLLDVNYVAGDLYAVRPIPVTFMIDADGVLRFAKYGEMTPDNLTEYLRLLSE